MAEKKEKQYVSDNAQLMAEWDWEKNINIVPSRLSFGSKKEVWWKCKKGHKWQARINSRVLGNGCPYCSGRYPITGETDLLTINPELAKEWHPTKNGELMSNQVFPGSGRKVWWQCSKGHEWQATIRHRAERGNGCPYCSGRYPITGETDLLTINPELAKEWHPTKNDDLAPHLISPNSNKKAWWLCTKGHEWQATVASRNQGSGCPTCSSEKQTSFPEQAILYYMKKVTHTENRWTALGKEIDIYLPQYQIGIEYNGAYYHTDKQRDKNKVEYFMAKGIRIISVNEGLSNCIDGDVISYKAKSNGSLDWAISMLFQILEITAPEIDIFSHAVEINNQYITSIKENSLASLYPELAKEWHPTRNEKLSPSQFTPNSNKRVWWLCKHEHEWQTAIANRTNGRGCPYCAQKRLLTGFNDLLTVNPELAKEWHPIKNGELLPQHVTSMNTKKVWWQCSRGHEWQATIASREKGSSCPICSNQKVLAGYNDLQTTHPELAKLWHPTKNGLLTPQMVTYGSGQKVWWQCENGHEWQRAIDQWLKGIGCPYYSGRRAVAGKTDLATQNPELAKEWHPTKNGELTPQDIRPKSGKKVWWQCAKGHEWEATIHNRSSGRGCPECAKANASKRAFEREKKRRKT